MNADISGGGEAVVTLAIENASEPHLGKADKPRLFVEKASPDKTVTALRDILARTGDLYDRGAPVRIAHDQSQKGAVAQLMTPEGLILLTHRICRPYALKMKAGSWEEVDVQLPRSFASMYLDWRGEWHLPPLNGIASAPLLDDGGAILSGGGYDRASGMWREQLPDLSALVPEHPSQADAAAALRILRETFKTFCFADARLVDCDGVQVVDLNTAPGKDESAFLAALLTAVCRPSVGLAPGVLIRAAQMSGAGAGKGLLARCIARIAFGREPHAVTGGHTAEELEKRISAELMEGNPVLFLDNLNNIAFRSNLLASAITERPARVRLLGRSQMVPLNPSAFVVLTGNGLSVSEDLARRFIVVELDPHTEDPESRRFTNNIRIEVEKNRIPLLVAALAIWRWGRLENPPKGLDLGSFETWCRWVRDPLVALGCLDPVERISEAKQRDGRRQATVEVFRAWHHVHGERPIAVRDLDAGVRQFVDPQGRGRQFVSAQLEKLTNTHIGGLTLTRQASLSKWGAATYAMKRIDGPEKHRDHREHGGGSNGAAGAGSTSPARQTSQSMSARDPKPPMVPMPSAASGEDHLDADEEQAAFDERAAFLEFEGGLTRTEAEARASAELGCVPQKQAAA